METATFLVIAAVIAIAIAAYFLKNRGEASPSAGPLDEAKIYIAYGRKKEAAALLRRHLEANPQDMEALRLLDTVKGA